MVTILETLADYITITHDTDMLTEYVRQNLKRKKDHTHDISYSKPDHFQL